MPHISRFPPSNSYSSAVIVVILRGNGGDFSRAVRGVITVLLGLALIMR